MREWVPSGQRVSEKYYTQVFEKMRKYFRKTHSELWNGFAQFICAQ